MEIKLENLVRTYSTVHAVDSVSLNIPSNTIYGIIGKSGAGKSSLVRLVSLLEKPDSGAVYYDGTRVDSLTGKDLIERRRHIGMIFQNFNLFASRTAAKNIAYPLEICGTPKAEIKKRVAEMLEVVGLSDRGDAPISTLSGGQKQRIAIARALATKPDILFCDEATSALDPQTTRSILSLIKEIQGTMNLTVVMITHQMEVVRDACEEVSVLDAGRVVESGSVVDIFSHPKSAVTKDFLSHLTTPALDGAKTRTGEMAEGVVRWSPGGGYVLRFVGQKTGEPVLSRMAKQFDVEFNILAGGVESVRGADVGVLVTDISGADGEVARALDYLASVGVTVEREGEGAASVVADASASGGAGAATEGAGSAFGGAAQTVSAGGCA